MTHLTVSRNNANLRSVVVVGMAVVVVVVAASCPAQVPQVFGHRAEMIVLLQPSPMVANRQPNRSLHSSCLSNFCIPTVFSVIQTTTINRTDAKCNMLLCIIGSTVTHQTGVEYLCVWKLGKVNYFYSDKLDNHIQGCDCVLYGHHNEVQILRVNFFDKLSTL